MKCRLCLREKELRNSHIIPEFFYKPLYDSQHRFQVVKFTAEETKDYLQKGIREKLLCYYCEQRLSPFEDHARRVFYGGQEFSFLEQKNRLVIKDIDYQKFKLFQLSLLWRAGVSSHPFFKGVTLGPHQERLRKMLHTKSPGQPYDYGCVLISVRMENGRPMDQLIERPFSFRSNGHRCCRFLLGGCYWVFVVSQHAGNFMHKQFFFSKDGTLIVHLIPAKYTGTIRRFANLLK